MKVLRIAWPHTPDGEAVWGAECEVLLDGQRVLNVIDVTIRFSASAVCEATVRAYRSDDGGKWPDSAVYDEERQEIVIDTYVLGTQGDGLSMGGDLSLVVKDEVILAEALT